ncbi:hypothetical protein LTR37_009173 [Vermiconidia calcicola]|uniref:Uncharacterized protein n=1 Tax=Vermiconidia calcicola TaxID=1690605 RepID=A0ACC3N8Y5_9PEZI|nr:hypothetical protein LTR37_009173 [Vermiconidia calcicola]
MADTKEYATTSADAVNYSNESPSGNTRAYSDAEAVARLGLTPTVPRTLTKLIGLIGVNSSVVVPWPTFIFVAVLNLSNGGTGGLVVDLSITIVFMIPVYISLAEKIRNFLCCGILTFTWLSYLTAATWLFALDITAIVLIQNGEYRVERAFAAAVVMQVISLVINLTWGKHMNVPETLILVVHFVAYLLIVSMLAFGVGTGTVSPNFEFFSQTGWSPSFGSVLGISYVVGVFSGFDSVSHLVEDTVDASRQVPRSLMWTTCANMLSCIPLVALVVLCAGDINTLFTEPLGASGHPFGAVIQLIHNAGRQNKALSSAVFALIAPIYMMSSINTTAAASRMLFSFVRDDHNPTVHKLMHKDLTEQRVPLFSICFMGVAPLLILWLNFVSSVAYSALISQVTLSLTTTYLMAVGCSLYSRFFQPDLLGRDFTGLFHLGQFWGTIVDGVSVVFLTFVWVLCWFPFTTPVDATTLNYAPIIDVGLGILFTVYYVVYARRHYKNPAPEEIGNVHR